jgi:DNA mismatch endonuclease (patch repair protein)
MSGESWASSDAARARMKSNRSRDTGPEIALRRAVHALGLRYRVDARPIANVRRTADLVFRRARIAVFVDGCFWHGCPIHYRAPVSNAAFWADKVARNRNRDREVDSLLSAAGWRVVRIWEHADLNAAALEIHSLVRSTD